MPLCPADRHCYFVQYGPFHPWWSGTEGALVLFIGILALAGVIGWATWWHQKRLVRKDYLAYQALLEAQKLEDQRIREKVTTDQATPTAPLRGV